MDGLWSIQITSQDGLLGNGIAVLENQRIMGGNSSYHYIGLYKMDEKNHLLGKLTVRHHHGPYNPLFGPLAEFKLNLSGSTGPNTMEVDGYLEGRPEVKIKATFKKLSNIT